MDGVTDSMGMSLSDEGFKTSQGASQVAPVVKEQNRFL